MLSNDDASRKNAVKTGFSESAEREVGKCCRVKGADRQLLSGKMKTWRNLPRELRSNSSGQFAFIELWPDVFIFVKFVAQSPYAHIEQSGGVSAIIFTMFQRGKNVMLFNF
jgi:hypothetical protein